MVSVLWLRRLAVLSVLVGSTLPIGIYLDHRLGAFGGLAVLVENNYNLLLQSTRGRYLLIDYINHYVPDDALVLTFRQNDLALYGKRKLIRHLDPRMAPVLAASDRNDAVRELRNLGVEYLLVPAYGLVTVFDSKIYEILADPAVSELVLESNGARLYRLRWENEKPDVTYKVIPVGEAGGTVVSCRKGALVVEGVANLHEPKNECGGIKSVFYTGYGDLHYPPLWKNPDIEPGRGYRLRSRVVGEGWLKITLVEYSLNGRVNFRPIWESTLIGSTRGVSIYFKTSRQTYNFRLLYEIYSVKQALTNGIELSRVENRDYADRVKKGMLWTTYDKSLILSVPKGIANSIEARSWAKNQCVYTGLGSRAVAPSRYGQGSGRYYIGGSKPRMFDFDIDGYVEGRITANVLLYSDGRYIGGRTLIDTLNLIGRPFELRRRLLIPPGVDEYRVELCLNHKDSKGWFALVKGWVNSIIIPSAEGGIHELMQQYNGMSSVRIERLSVKLASGGVVSVEELSCISNLGQYTSSKLKQALSCINNLP